MFTEMVLTPHRIVGIAEQHQRRREERLSVPGPGRTLSMVVGERAVHIRRAVHAMEQALGPVKIEEDFRRLFDPKWEVAPAPASSESIVTRAAWALTNIWLLARSSGAIGPHATVTESEQWFFGIHQNALPSLAAKLPEEAERRARRSLCAVVCDEGFRDLLPYLLEPHGPGSRLSVMRNPSTLSAWEAKRRSGVFYTPADVAEYIVESVLAEHGGEASDLRCLDPSCGTGVFLLAMMRTVAPPNQGRSFNKLEYALRCLYGLDVSALAVETSAFVLLHQCLGDVRAAGSAPWCAWHALRLNLAVVDALSIRRKEPKEAHAYLAAARSRDNLRATLLDPASPTLSFSGRLAPRYNGTNGMRAWIAQDDGWLSLEAIYPEAAEGFGLLIGNPPYTSLGQRQNGASLREEYASLRGNRLTGSENIYPLFIEMMWRLTRPGRNASALVVPLSIAYHQGGQYVACRRAMGFHGGRWRCAFFDREPHALFGEDVKTRNAIILRRESAVDPSRGCPAEIETGPLRKWTSRTRERLFSSITFTPLGRTEVARGFPKLDGKEQAEAFGLLSGRRDAMRTLWRRAWTCRPIEACVEAAHPRVFVASTAYNFLNVFRMLTVDPHVPHPLTENTVLCLEFSREDLANTTFAILSSRLTYWLWQAQADGFHVPQWFVENLPFGRSSFDCEQAEALGHHGGHLWQVLQRHRIVSVNGGRQTIAFRPLSCERERDAIDEILIRAVGLPDSFIRTLRDFVRRTVVVDEMDDRRSHLKSYFRFGEDT